ncbi:HelD family protein [Dermacoccus abyssi]
MPAPTSDAVLTHEREHLARARANLARMREATLALDASKASDAVSGEALGATLARRVAALTDDPSTTLFFGRIDYTDPTQATAHEEQLYVGRRHVSDEDGDPLVIDWRAPVSTAFYRASPAEPMGVSLRRRFGVERGELTAYEDEHLSHPDEGDRVDGDLRSAILAEEIERPRSGPMRDIVSTIQPEQDALVRADVTTTVCIQGAPGTGKTAVGLHRAAWLLYTFRARLDRAGVLVVGPNAAFLDHISAVLPSLGEARVRHATIATLLSGDADPETPKERRWVVRGTDDVAVAVLKGDARWAPVIQRAVWAHVGEPTEALVVPRGSRRWRVAAYEVAEIVDELRTRGVRYEAARAMLAQRLAHAVMVKLEASGDSPDDRVQDAIARSAPVKAYVKALWPKIDAAGVVHRLLSDADFLSECAREDLDADEQALALWAKPPRAKGSARWSVADLGLLDEAADAIERTTSLGHVIVDEAQDLSAMQLRAVGRRCSTGSATVLGDIAQATTPWAPGSWDASMGHLGKPEFHLEELRQGFRVPAAVIEYAALLLPTIAAGLAAPESVRSNRGRLEHLKVDGAQALPAGTLDAIRAAASEPGSVGVIAVGSTIDALESALRDAGLAYGRLGSDHGDAQDHQIELVPSDVAKGLEFDRVVVVEPADIVAAEADELTGLRRLYVVLTRAVSALTIVHAKALPPQLSSSAAPAGEPARPVLPR